MSRLNFSDRIDRRASPAALLVAAAIGVQSIVDGLALYRTHPTDHPHDDHTRPDSQQELHRLFLYERHTRWPEMSVSRVAFLQGESFFQ
jgi:hypothetical protein